MSGNYSLETFSPLFHEVVGSRLTICESPCSSIEQTSGEVVFETKNMIQIRTDEGVKKFAKSAMRRLYLKNKDGGYFISGSSLIGRPEERVSRTN